MAEETDTGADRAPPPSPAQGVAAQPPEPRKRPQDEDRYADENSVAPGRERAAEQRVPGNSPGESVCGWWTRAAVRWRLRGHDFP